MLKLIFFSIFCSCSSVKKIQVDVINIEKPKIEFSTEPLEKPTAIMHDKCYMVNSPQIPVICMLPEEFDKDIRNYKVMLGILKQYQVSDSYYNAIK